MVPSLQVRKHCELAVSREKDRLNGNEGVHDLRDLVGAAARVRQIGNDEPGHGWRAGRGGHFGPPASASPRTPPWSAGSGRTHRSFDNRPPRTAATTTALRDATQRGAPGGGKLARVSTCHPERAPGEREQEKSSNHPSSVKTADSSEGD